jgi:hypothetical protein
MNMKAWIVTSLAAGSLAVAGAGSAADITVMTQNQYLGADIAPLVDPSKDFNEEVLKAFLQIAANKPAERIAALAAEIVKESPHLVGLQEVFGFSCQPQELCSLLPPELSGAFNDHLALTETALGDSYTFVAQVTNLDVTLPFPLYEGGPSVYISVIDRDVILARSDVRAVPLDPSVVAATCSKPSDDGCNYVAVLPLPAGLGGNIERDWVAALASVNDRRYLFVNTHLETREPFPYFQGTQARQLVATLQALAPRSPPIILVGDFNSDPNDTTFLPTPPAPFPQFPPVSNPYVQLTAARLNDAWLFRPGNVPGLSCCQAADLSNHNSQVYERIDLIWSSEVPRKVKDARVVGETVNFKTKPQGRGLWPSDHGAVVATLQFR